MNAQKNCDYFESMLFECDDENSQRSNELSSLDRIELESHLKDCPRCRAALAREQGLTRLLTAANRKSDHHIVATKSRTWQPVIWSALTAIAVSLIVLSVLVLNGLKAKNYRQTYLGSITSQPYFTDVRYDRPPEKKELQNSNHIKMPTGTSATVSLNEIGQLRIIGPTVVELDRLAESWKLTVLQGQVTAQIEPGNHMVIANQLGVTKIHGGKHVVGVTTNLQDQKSQEDTPGKLMDKAFAEFYKKGSGKKDMARSAALLKQALEHRDATDAEKNKARFYRAAALANAKDHKAAIAAALDWQKNNPNEKSEVILDIIAMSQWELGKKDEAKKIWAKMLKENPKSRYKPYIEARLGKSTGLARTESKTRPARRTRPQASASESAAFNAKQKSGYLVVAVGLEPSNVEHQKFEKVAHKVIQFHRGQKRQVDFFQIEPNEVGKLREKIISFAPENVLFVIPPEKLDVNFHRQVFMLAPTMDSDPFADFAFGYLTARDGATVEKLWARIESLHKKGLKTKTWVTSSVVGGKSKSYVNDKASALPASVRAAGFTGKSIHYGIIDNDPEVMKFVKREIKNLEPASVITMWGNGDPQGIWLFNDSRNADRSKHWRFDPAKVGSQSDQMPRITADYFRDLKLSSPIIWSGTCHSGACRSVYVEGDIVSTFGRSDQVEKYDMKPDESMCLALIDAGAAALLVPIASNHGYSAYNEMSAALSFGLSLGETLKFTYDDICFQAGGVPELIIAKQGDAHNFHGENVMQGGGANRLLIGDPALMLFTATEIPGEKVTVDKKSDCLIVNVEWNKGFHPWSWNMYTDNLGGARSRIFTRVPIPSDVEIPRTTKVKVSVFDDKGASAIEIYEPEFKIETFNGKKFLHLQATTTDTKSRYANRKAVFVIGF